MSGGFVKAKGSAHKHCPLVDKRSFPWKHRLTAITLLYMYNANEQLSKWMADGGSQISSHCWSEFTDKQEKTKMIQMSMNKGERHLCEFILSLTQTHSHMEMYIHV